MQTFRKFYYAKKAAKGGPIIRILDDPDGEIFIVGMSERTQVMRVGDDGVAQGSVAVRDLKD